MRDQVIKRDGCDRRLVTDPPAEGYRLVGWHCIYHEQVGRMCHNPLDCDMVPVWALTVEAAHTHMELAREETPLDMKTGSRREGV